jgi:hypothetical protein
MSQPKTIQANALRVLQAIYETRDRNSPVFVTELNIGLGDEESKAAWRYLRDKGLIETFSLDYTARINGNGIDAIENQPTEQKVARIEKTVFISYRRIAVPWAQSIFQDLTHHDYDVFIDFQGIASGGFEEVIFENIKARAHFLVLLTPSALERCNDPADLFRREIETAIGSQRNIVPIMLEGFDFSASGVDSQLGETLNVLKQYNGLPVYAPYVPEAMNRLRKKYLTVPLDTVLHPVSPSADRAAKADQAAAANAPPVTEKELREAGQPRYFFNVKIKYQDEPEKPEGTHAEEPYGPGSLIIYDGESVIARYDNVQRWSRQRT